MSSTLAARSSMPASVAPDWRGCLFVAILMAIFVTLASFGFGGTALAPSDGDGWMHGLRIKTWLAGGDPDFVRGNSPDGFVIHWTRPFDVLLLVLMAPLRLVLPQEAALEWAMRFSHWPLGVLTIAASLGFGQGVARRLGLVGAQSRGVLLLAALPMALAPIYWVFGGPTRVDHHLLVVGLTVLGAAILLSASTRRGFLAAGLLGGLAVWTSVEALPGLAVFFGLALGFRAAIDPEDTPSPAPVLFGMVMVILAALLVDPAYDGALTDLDRVSFVHLVGPVVALGVALLIGAVLHWQKRPWRFWATLIAAAAGGVATILLFPQVMDAETAVIGPYLAEVWWPRLKEIGSVASVADFFVQLGQPAGALMLTLAVAGRRLRSGDRRGGAAILVMAIGMTAIILAAALHLRFTSWALVVTMVGFLVGLADLHRLMPRGLIYVVALALAVPAVALCVTLVGRGRDAAEIAPGNAAVGAEAVQRAVCSASTVLDEIRRIGDVGVVIVPDRFVPELLFRAPEVKTIAGSYQRNIAGLTDHFRFMLDETPDAETAREVARRRQVTHVLVCDGRIAGGSTLNDAMLAMRIGTGQVPSWLEPVAGVVPSLRVYAAYP